MIAGGGLGAPPVPGRIPWSAIDRWACRYGITGGNHQLLLRAIALMDSILIDHIRSKGDNP